MNQIEKVARAICRADPEVRMGDADGVVEQRANTEWVHYVDQAKAAIAAMPVQAEPVAWHSPLGGLIEARQIARQAYKDIEREKSINGHIAGKPYDVALSALNSVLGCLAVLVDPTPPAGGSDAE